jgi:hypothetical protein
MPMVIDRRQVLTLAAAGLALPARAGRAAAPVELAAAWRDAAPGYRVGRLALAGEALVLRASIEVPTRAHGLLAEPGGTLLAVARRPGDWLLRFSRAGRELQWLWIEPDRAFTGHLARSADGRHVFSGETDLESGAGLIGVRDARSLEKLDEWASHGVDVHELLPRGDALWVANGGIQTQPETGRLKLHLPAMDSSLVRLDAKSGALRGQWRVPDPRLSLRHLAWRADGRLGIAIQAEHEDAAAKAAAPILAVFDGRALKLAEGQPQLAGYGGDIAASAAGFAIGCPRSGGVARFDAEGRWQGLTLLPEACALAEGADGLWAGGRGRALQLPEGQAKGLPGLELDNHWIRL